MFITDKERVVIFLIVSLLFVLLLIGFIVFIIYKYQIKQNAYFKSLEQLKTNHENDMLKSILEIQEQTFTNISREIHDNIGQKLTLAKLHLNTLDLSNVSKITSQISDSVIMISESINDLSDISRSMSSEIILNNGFMQALEFEVNQLNKSGLYNIKLSVTGESVFLEANKELVLFRITQEALNNIVKHSQASNINIRLHFQYKKLVLEITDDGKGFKIEYNKLGNGLNNMSKRAKLLNGICEIYSQPGNGTTIKIEIPLHENNQDL